MIRITVAQADARAIKYTDKAGKPAVFHVQPAYAHTVDRQGNPPPYPEKVELALDRDPQTGEPLTYAPGDYQLHPSSIYVDRNGRLAVSARLAPLTKKPAAT
ncbi:single-stranded DNA-binding protein [Aquabacterium sp.]|uniref:single-stranded DNA-binding protein n=1 Tax=Aquabacterium sp. TaxID=1872578 RepID=UPI0037847FF7